jgi:hypothetical protein
VIFGDGEPTLSLDLLLVVFARYVVEVDWAILSSPSPSLSLSLPPPPVRAANVSLLFFVTDPTALEAHPGTVSLLGFSVLSFSLFSVPALALPERFLDEGVRELSSDSGADPDFRRNEDPRLEGVDIVRGLGTASSSSELDKSS